MSQVIEESVNLGGLTPDLIETSTGKKIKQASAVRWLWQCLRDIKLYDNLQPAVMNSLTLREKIVMRGSENVPISDPVTILRRCQPYPLTNCEYNIARHEARRYGDLSQELPENDLPDSYAGANPITGKAPAQVSEQKFAYSAARELSQMYAKEYGLVILEPLTGIEDSDTVRQVFKMVQPVTYKLSVLERELTVGAKERIRKSTYDTKIKDLAEECRLLMVKGFQAAVKFAQEHMADFSRQIQLASAGHKGQRAFPSTYDEFMAEQLGVEVPRVVQTERKSDRSEALLEQLAEKELARGNENDSLYAALQEERAARVALEARLDKMEKVA
jgi:hypothetical protein